MLWFKSTNAKEIGTLYLIFSVFAVVFWYFELVGVVSLLIYYFFFIAITAFGGKKFIWTKIGKIFTSLFILFIFIALSMLVKRFDVIEYLGLYSLPQGYANNLCELKNLLGISFNNIVSLNTIWSNFGIIDFSLVRCLNTIFFIFFIFLNIALVYLEFLDVNCKNKSDSPQFLTAGPMFEKIKKAAGIFLVSASAYSNYLTISNANEPTYKQKAAEFEKQYNETKSLLEKVKNDRIMTNLIHKLNFENIDTDTSKLTKIKTEKSELLRRIEDNKWNAKFKDGKTDYKELIRKDEKSLQLLGLEEERAISDLKSSVNCGSSYAQHVHNKTNETEMVEFINQEDIKKSSILDFDLEAWWVKFETLSGLNKLVCTMLLSNYLILWCIYSILIGIYGEYLLNRFKLEERFPKIAFIIKYRKRVQKYYMITNFLMIIIICLINMVFGLSVLSLLY
jgi:hypothetical protein